MFQKDFKYTGSHNFENVTGLSIYEKSFNLAPKAIIHVTTIQLSTYVQLSPTESLRKKGLTDQLN